MKNNREFNQTFVSKEFDDFQKNLDKSFGDFCREFGLHHCMTHNEDGELFEGEDPAIVICHEDEAGYLWAGNDTDINCMSVVNYCPYCGYKSKRQIKH